MDSTFVSFVPSTVGPFTFSPIIAGATYNAEIDYNAFGQRFYLNLTDLTGASIAYCAVAETGPSFQATFNWSVGTASITCEEPHQVPIGQMVRGRISQTESGFDALSILLLAINPTTLTFPLSEDPEVEPVQGVLSLGDVNLVEGIIPGGLLVYHGDVASFEFV
jgi:hypothetical protein